MKEPTPSDKGEAAPETNAAPDGARTESPLIEEIRALRAKAEALEGAELEALCGLGRRADAGEPEAEVAKRLVAETVRAYLTASWTEHEGVGYQPVRASEVGDARRRIAVLTALCKGIACIENVVTEVRSDCDAAERQRIDMGYSSYILIGVTALYFVVMLWLSFKDLTYTMDPELARQTVYGGLSEGVNALGTSVERTEKYLQFQTGAISLPQNGYATAEEAVREMADGLGKVADWKGVTPEAYKERRESARFRAGLGKFDNLLIALAGIALYVFACRIPGFAINRRKAGLSSVTALSQAGFLGIGGLLMMLIAGLLSIGTYILKSAKTVTVITEYASGRRERSMDYSQHMIALMIFVVIVAFIVLMVATVVSIIAQTLWLIALLTWIRNRPEAFVAWAQRTFKTQPMTQGA